MSLSIGIYPEARPVNGASPMKTAPDAGPGAVIRRAKARPVQQAQAASARSADSSVLTISMVMVIGPTPPGTGVM